MTCYQVQSLLICYYTCTITADSRITAILTRTDDRPQYQFPIYIIGRHFKVADKHIGKTIKETLTGIGGTVLSIVRGAHIP